MTAKIAFETRTQNFSLSPSILNLPSEMLRKITKYLDLNALRYFFLTTHQIRNKYTLVDLCLSPESTDVKKMLKLAVKIKNFKIARDIFSHKRLDTAKPKHLLYACMTAILNKHIEVYMHPRFNEVLQVALQLVDHKNATGLIFNASFLKNAIIIKPLIESEQFHNIDARDLACVFNLAVICGNKKVAIALMKSPRFREIPPFSILIAHNSAVKHGHKEIEIALEKNFQSNKIQRQAQNQSPKKIPPKALSQKSNISLRPSESFSRSCMFI